MTGDSRPGNPDLVDGWKAIAEHLGKSVRTAQRWKRDLELPVHKAGGRDTENVFAYRSELDAWRQAARRRAATTGAAALSETTDLDDGPAPEEASAFGGTMDAGEASRPGGSPRDEPTQAEAATTTVAPGLRGRSSIRSVLLGVTGAIGLAVVIGLAGGWRPMGGAEPGTSTGPAKYRIRANTLAVFDADGRPLWQHDFPTALNTKRYRQLDDPARIHERDEPPPLSEQALGSVFPLVQFVDLNGDGRNEVLFIPAHEGQNKSHLLCFDAQGKIRWEYASSYPVNFGDQYFGPLSFATGVFVTESRSGSPRIWATFDHEIWFPSVLVEIDASGKQTADYWTNGRVTAVSFMSVAGRAKVLVGAPNNETGGASVAVLDQDRITGSAPAVKTEYQCLNCPPGRPEHVLVFPRTDVKTAVGGHAAIETLVASSDRQIVVGTYQVQIRTATQIIIASTIYTLDERFKVLSAEFYSQYQSVHDLLFKEGRLDHKFDEQREASQLWPVLRWNGTGWDTIRGPESR